MRKTNEGRYCNGLDEMMSRGEEEEIHGNQLPVDQLRLGSCLGVGAVKKEGTD